MSKLADLIWKNAELLRGAYKGNEYRKVILPFTVLRHAVMALVTQVATSADVHVAKR